MIARNHNSQSHFGRISGGSKIAPFLLMLVFSKLSVICGTFIVFDVLQSSSLLQVISTQLMCCSLPYILLYQPKSAIRPLSKQLWVKVIFNSGWFSLVMILWGLGLKAVGPTRTILIFDHHETIVLACISYLIAGNDKYKSRGAMLFILGLLTLLFIDNDSAVNTHIESENENIIFHIIYAFFDQLGVPDHKHGVLVLFIALLLSTLQRSYQKKLAVETGGDKKLHTTTVTLGGIMLSLPAIVQMMTGDSTMSFSAWVSGVLPWCILVAIVTVANYTVEKIAISRLDTNRVVKYSFIITCIVVLGMGTLWHGPLINVPQTPSDGSGDAHHHHLSGGVFLSIACLVLSTVRLSKQSGPSHGTFIGYGDTGLPMYTFDKKIVKSKVMPFIKSTLGQIMSSSDSRQIFYFLCINLFFCGVELLYGIWSNSLGLISDGFHMLFDCAALLVGLLAAIMQKWPKTRVYSYGFARVDILSGYVNALLLCVVAFFVFTEALERLIDPPEVSTDRLFIVSVAGLLVNLIGIFAFSHAHSHGGAPCSSHGNPGNSGHGHSHDGHGHSHDGHGHSHDGHGHSHDGHGHNHDGHGHSHDGHGHSHGEKKAQNRNLQGVFLHIMADTLGSVGVILSSLFIEYFGWLRSDPLCSIIIAVLIFLSVIPLLKDSILVLLQHIPSDKQAEFYGALDDIQSVENVVNIYDPHLWQYSSNTCVASLRLYVNARANEQAVIARATEILKSRGFTETSVQVEKELFKKALVSYGPSLLDKASDYNIGIYNRTENVFKVN